MRHLVSALALALLIALSVAGGVAPASAAGTATLEVTVQLAGAPVPDVVVDAGPVAATTDVNGVATFTGLDAGTYRLVVDHAAEDGRSKLYGVLQVAVVAGQTRTVTMSVLSVPIQSGIGVQVTDQTFGGAVPGALVVLRTTGGSLADQKYTDEEGFAQFDDPARGSYVATATAPGYRAGTPSGVIAYEPGGYEFANLPLVPELDCAPPAANPAFVNGGFESGLSGWTTGRTTGGGVQVVGADAHTGPWEGTRMLRLGVPTPDQGDEQEPGPNVVCQDFTVTRATESFAFNAFGWDYTGQDLLRVDVAATDAASGEVLATYSEMPTGERAELKTTGWRGVRLDLADSIGKVVRLTVRAAGTRDALYGFWAYLDSAATAPPTAASMLRTVSPTTSVTTDPATGQVVVAVPRTETDDFALTFAPRCARTGTPTAVALTLPGSARAATSVGGGLWRVTLPASAAGDEPSRMTLQSTCAGQPVLAVPLGRLVRSAAGGTVRDAATGAPIAGAQVRLHRVPGWTARGPEGPYDATSCESVLSKEPGADWSQAAPTGSGVPVRAGDLDVLPQVQPMSTSARGGFGWTVLDGCWYVVVSAPGYVSRTGPVVGVVTDAGPDGNLVGLDIALVRDGPSAACTAARAALGSAQAAVTRAVAAVKAATAKLAKAKAKLTRAKRSGAKARIANAKAAQRKAKAGLASANAGLSRARSAVTSAQAKVTAACR